MTKDLTAGNPMRLILGFALPTLFGMLFQQLYRPVAGGDVYPSGSIAVRTRLHTCSLSFF